MEQSHLVRPGRNDCCDHLGAGSLLVSTDTLGTAVRNQAMSDNPYEPPATQEWPQPKPQRQKDFRSLLIFVSAFVGCEGALSLTGAEILERLFLDFGVGMFAVIIDEKLTRKSR